MPTINMWLGDARPVRQIERVLFRNLLVGSRIKFVVNGKVLTHTVTASESGSAAAVSAAIRSELTEMFGDETSLADLSLSVVNDEAGVEIGFDVYGATTGKPFTFSVGGAVSVKVTEAVAGVVGRNMVQVVAIPGSPSSGNFTLTFNGQTTANIAYNASAATVQTALEGLSNIDSGDVSVTGSNGGPWAVEFTGRFAGMDPADVPAGSGSQGTGRLIFANVSLAQASYGAYTRRIVNGGGRKNAVAQVRVLGTPTVGKYRLTYKRQTTSELAYNANAATVQTALEALSTIGSGNVVVSGSLTAGFRIEFVGALAGQRADRFNPAPSVLVGDRMKGDALIEVVRLTDGPDLGSPSAGMSLYPAILVKPNRVASTPDVVSLRVVHPVTQAASSVMFEDGESEDEVQSRLNSLPNFSSTQFIVTLVETGYRIDVTGNLGGYDWGVANPDAADTGAIYATEGATVELLQASGTSSARSWQARILSAHDGLSLTLSGPKSDGTWTTCTFNSNDNQTTIQTAINSASIVLSVSVSLVSSLYRQFTFTYTPDAASIGSSVTPSGDITLTGSNAYLTLESLIAQQGDAGINSVVELGYIGYPSAGTVSLSVTDETGANQAVTATVGTEASDINTALGETAVREVQRDEVTNSVWLEWVGPSYAGLQVRLPSVTGNSLSGSTGNVAVVLEPRTAVYAEQEVSVANATGGTFTLTLEGQTTAAIPWNAEAGFVRSALEALSNVDPGDVVVYGDGGGPYRIVFLPEFGGGPDVDLITVDSSSLTSSLADAVSSFQYQAATGPAHFDNAENWSLGRMPQTGDTLLFANSSRPVLYGLEYPSIVPDAIYFESTFVARCGLPDYDEGSAVTLPKELTLGTNGAGTMLVVVGRGDGSGSPLIRLNTGSKQTKFIVRQTAQPTESVAAFEWRGTHASNAGEVYRGSVGIGVGMNAATLSSLIIGYVSSRDSDANVWVGDQVTLTTVSKDGGVAKINCAATTLTNAAGELEVDGSGAVTNVYVNGGTVFYSSTGTLGTAKLANDGRLSFDRSLSAKTVTNPIEVYGDEADVIDSNMVVTNLKVKYMKTTRQPSLGVNYQIDRTVL